eukprot:CFRG0236T1
MSSNYLSVDDTFSEHSRDAVSLCDTVSLRVNSPEPYLKKLTTTLGSSRVEDASTIEFSDAQQEILPLRVKDPKNSVFYANTPEPFEVDNEHCEGRAILKVKTTKDSMYAPYFSNKKRQYEIMIEGTIKSVNPDDNVYIGIESNKEVRLNFFTRAFAKGILKLIHSSTANVHATLGDKQEVCQMTMPLHTTVDSFIVTPEGGTPPPLGVEGFDPELSTPKNHRPKTFSYSPTETYSFTMHGMYVDLVSWKIVNLPGLPDISLNKFLGDMPLYFVGYILPKDHTGKHLQGDKNYMFKFELENDNAFSRFRNSILSCTGSMQ